jgi:hypothetical protein
MKVLQGYAIDAKPDVGISGPFVGDICAVLTSQDISANLQWGEQGYGRPSRGDR